MLFLVPCVCEVQGMEDAFLPAVLHTLVRAPVGFSGNSGSGVEKNGRIWHLVLCCGFLRSGLNWCHCTERSLSHPSLPSVAREVESCFCEGLVQYSHSGRKSFIELVYEPSEGGMTLPGDWRLPSGAASERQLFVWAALSEIISS